MKAQKRPVIVDYFSIDTLSLYETTNLINWIKSFGDIEADVIKFEQDMNSLNLSLRVLTLEGTSYEVTKKDVIIRRIKGEYYPCKKDIFYDSYLPIASETLPMKHKCDNPNCQCTK
jgi:hypothetical protein